MNIHSKNVPAMLKHPGTRPTPLGDVDMNIVTEKKCTKCGKVKPINNFRPRKDRKNLYRHCCRECDADYQRERYKNDRQHCRDISNKYRLSHLESERKRVRECERVRRKVKAKEISASRKKSYQNNKEEIIKKTGEWQKNHPERRSVYFARRKAQKLLSGGSGVTPQQWLEICKKYGYKCLCCKKTDVQLTMDHVVPLSRGGLHDPSNIQPLCRSCNSSKRADTVDYRDFK